MGETALHMASHKGDLTTLTVLLKYSPKLNILDVVRSLQADNITLFMIDIIDGVHTYIKSGILWSC